MATGWDTHLTRQIGEHLVTAELGKRGFAATPFAGNIPEWDIVAADESGRVVPIQVKAINPNSSWQLTVKRYIDFESAEDEQVVLGPRPIVHGAMVCIFVALQTQQPDDFFIFTLHEFQKFVIERYKPRKKPLNIASYHHAIWPVDMERFRDRWDVLTDAFSKQAHTKVG